MAGKEIVQQPTPPASSESPDSVQDPKGALISPKSNDWEVYRPLITRLYIDEGRKLSEVIERLKTENKVLVTYILRCLR